MLLLFLLPRPPLPGTATPAGYVKHLKPPPPDATPLEIFRNRMLDWGTHPLVAAFQLVWLLGLVVTFVFFIGCLLYWFNWGYLTDPVFPCTHDHTLAGEIKFECVGGHYVVLAEDYWQEKMTQILSALFTYSTLLAAPWRFSILHQLYSERCSGKARPRIAPLALSSRLPLCGLDALSRICAAVL